MSGTKDRNEGKHSQSADKGKSKVGQSSSNENRAKEQKAPGAKEHSKDSKGGSGSTRN